MPSGVLRVNSRPAKIKLRIKSSGAPASANVEITDVMLQPGASVSGWLPHVTEMPWVSGVTDMDSGGGSVVIRWEDIEGKPLTYPPANHAHAIADVEGLQAVLDDKATVTVDRTSGTVATLEKTDGDVTLLASTGVRNITADWDNGMPGAPSYSQAWMYREGDSVTLMLNLAKDGGSVMKYMLPSGFKPSTATLVTTSAYTRLDAKSVLMQISGGAIYGVYNQEAPMDDYSDVVGQWTWHTSDPWPTSLPGVPT